MMLAAMIKIPWLHYKGGGGYWTLPPMLGGHRKTMRKIDYCGKPWVAGKAEPISPRVAASPVGEPMLGCNIGWTRRGVPFWEDNRSDGTMVPSWMRSGPISQGGYSTYKKQRTT